MKTILNVQGMSCEHCEKAVKKALLALNGVKSVDVNLKNKTVSVEHLETVTAEVIKTEITTQGYDVE